MLPSEFIDELPLEPEFIELPDDEEPLPIVPEPVVLPVPVGELLVLGAPIVPVDPEVLELDGMVVEPLLGGVVLLPVPVGELLVVFAPGVPGAPVVPVVPMVPELLDGVVAVPLVELGPVPVGELLVLGAPGVVGAPVVVLPDGVVVVEPELDCAIAAPPPMSSAAAAMAVVVFRKEPMVMTPDVVETKGPPAAAVQQGAMSDAATGEQRMCLPRFRQRFVGHQLFGPATGRFAPAAVAYSGMPIALPCHTNVSARPPCSLHPLRILHRRHRPRCRRLRPPTTPVRPAMTRWAAAACRVKAR